MNYFKERRWFDVFKKLQKVEFGFFENLLVLLLFMFIIVFQKELFFSLP